MPCPVRCSQFQCRDVKAIAIVKAIAKAIAIVKAIVIVIVIVKSHRQNPMDKNNAYLRLTALCAASEQCKSDVRKKMQRWELSAEEQEQILRRLVDERFIDEQRYATAFVRDKSRYNKWGRQKIKSELIRRGIPSHHIDTALCEINEDENTETLRHIIDTKRRTVKGKTEYEIRTKLIRFALSRGFEMSDILKVVGSADNDEW